MVKKRTIFIMLILTLAIIAAMAGMVACTDNKGQENPPPDDSEDIIREEMTFSQYMNKINAGLKGSESVLQTATDYHVSSEYTLYTREENLTIKYEAVYRQNRRDGIYHIRIFDNGNHLERLNVYYDAADLYVTAEGRHYIIEDFSTLLIFDTFSALLDLADIGELVYGETMQTYFSETTILSSIMGVRNLDYLKTGENNEKVTVSNVDLWAIQGTVNAQVAALGDRLGSSFDAITDYYLGFSLSRLLDMTFGSIIVNQIDFNIYSGNIGSTKVDVGGRMQDNTQYFIKGEYSYDSTTDEITSAKSIPTDYVYEPVTPGKGSFEGKTIMPTMRDSDFDFSLDYNLNSVENNDNEFTLRIYDQLATSDSLTQANKYENINEIISAYYKEGIFYVNTEGAYEYIGTTIALNALRLPKIYFTGLNVSSIMSIAYTDLLQILKIITAPTGEVGAADARLLENLQNAIESDVEKQEIKITVTESLIKEIRGDDTDLAVLLGEALGVDEDTVLQYLGNDFFQLLSIVIRYNFGTGVFGIDVYNGTELIMSTDMQGIDYGGIKFPNDLNELNYTEFREPDIVTVTYDIEINPYGAENVDLSEFIGAFVGDSTGKNTPYTLSTGYYISAQGRISEYYITDASGTRKAVTTMDMKIYSVKNISGEQTLLMTLTTNPYDVGQMLVGLYTAVGDYDGKQGGIEYVMDREKISEQLSAMTDGESIFAGNTGLSAFLSIYNAAEKNSKTYTDDGFFCVDLMATEEKDPVYELVGVENTNARIKCKIGFDTLDLSGVDADRYTVPYIHIPDDVSATSIYSDGSQWKPTAEVAVGGKSISMKLTYREETTTIVTGQTEYTPVAEIFGKEFSYALHILNITGTYKVRSVNITNDTLVIDPLLTKTVPSVISVMFEGGETGELGCIVEGFPDSRVTLDGYNLPLLAGVTGGMEKYKLVIGKDSIASIEQEIYVAVINRRVIAQEDSSGNEMIYVYGDEQIPVVAEFNADPYTYAMTKRLRMEEGETYDYLTEQLSSGRNTLRFENLYGYETVIDDKTGEEIQVPLYYDVEGYNWVYLYELNLDWSFSQEAFSWRGETRYAVATYGDADKGYAIKIAVKVNVKSKIVSNVIIDTYAEGTYIIDYLKEETYSIPTVTGGDHTVKVVFEDGTQRTVSLTRPAIIGDEEYCETYIYGQLLWEGTDGLSDKLDEHGTTGLFGTGTKASNVTTAKFGGDISESTQTVSLTVIAPSRYISSSDTVSMSLVTEISADGVMGNPVPVQVTKAQFEKPSSDDEEIKSFGINPYNKEAYLPETIWLYVPMTMDDNGRKEWVEYPVEWLTTDKPTSGTPKELNIIKRNEEGRYVLAHPVTKETRLVVYGLVGAPSRKITVTMSLLNMASNIENYELYLPDGSTFDKNQSVSVDPYLSYKEVLPSRFNALLGSGQTVEGDTDWYYGEYPIIRSGKYLGAEYNGMYDKDGYYIFPKGGGQFSLMMTVSEGEVSNELYLEVSVDSRDIYSSYETSGNTITRISDYVEIFAEGKNDGEVYEGEPSPGYQNINYYTEYSSVFLKRIEELIENGGVGIAGFAFEQTGINKLYAKEVRWNVSVLQAIGNGLKKAVSARTFTLGGTLDYGTVNEMTVSVLVTIDSMTATLTEVGLTRSEDMRLKDVYVITNDLNADGQITLTAGGEGKKLVDAAYYRNEQYKNYFGVEEGYTDIDFSNVIYFEIDTVHMLSTVASGVYSSPYDYFVYLFDNLSLKFTSEKIVKATAKNSINMWTRNAEYFNSSLLGLIDENLYRDESGKAVSYAFMILEKLSEGSAIDRTLIIVTANKANATELQREDEVDAFGEDLTELYPERYNLPSVIEVVYEKEDGTGSYTAKFAVNAWTPNLASYFGSTDPISAIEARYINVIDGSSYGFSYELPDMKEADNLVKTFYYTVEFRRKDIQKINYDAAARSSVYDIENGKIHVVNSYSFLTRDIYAEAGKEYVFNKEAIPTILGMYTNTGTFHAGVNDNYKVNWTFNENAAFGEEIFARGTVLPDGTNPGILVATYVFDSYYDKDGNHLTQTIELYLVIEPMEFYSIESETLKIIEGIPDAGSNPTFNTIEIDPYNDTAGFNGNLVLPTTLTLVFNGSQRYTFSNIIYMLADENGTARREISIIPYGEKGHKLTYDYTPDPSLLKLVMYIEGYSQNTGKGIRIDIKFLKRTITDSRIPNPTYQKDTGTYVYETDAGGNIVTENGEPKKKTYYSYADYTFEYELNGGLFTEEGKMPIYYIDPYNQASFVFPTEAAFEFAETAPGVYVEYGITGWQYYNVETDTYVDFTTIAAGETPSDKDRFYQILSEDGRSYRGYFNASVESYKGAYYPIRGYIRVGNDSQYFEVICIVLNRSLRSSAILKDEYTVSYDFADPIAAMLEDIPAMLGEDAFVDFDRYNDEFSVYARRTEGLGTYSFTLGDGAHFSRIENGSPTNFAVVPELLWEEEYDTDGDGIPDTLFDELTTKGFVGVIGGNIFSYDVNLDALFDYYGIKVNYDYEQLIMALMWDTLFAPDGSVSNAYSVSARNAISAQNAQLEQEVIHAVYNILLSVTGTEEDIAQGKALSEENKQMLGSSLLEIILQEINREAQLSGSELYDPNDEEDMIYIAYRIYLNVKEEYEAWEETSGEKTAKAEIYEAWEYNLKEYRSADVTDSRRISGNQVFKAKHFLNIISTEGTLNNEEKNNINTAMTVLRNGLYIKINNALWEEVYANANAFERVAMDEYASSVSGGDAEMGISIACDLLKAEKGGLTELGVKGEAASADISIPVITFDSMTVEGTDTPIIKFNKFNFASIDKEFSVRFELSYEEIYEQMLEEARENAIKAFRDDKKSESLSKFEEDEIRDRVDGIAPKVLNENGEYVVIDGMIYGNTAFGYDMWNAGNRKTQYASFWEELYTYRQNDAVKVITANVAGIADYAGIANDFEASTDEVDKVLTAFSMIKVPAMAEEFIAIQEETYDFDSNEERRNAVRAVAEYVQANNSDIRTISEAYVEIGLDANYAIDSTYEVTEEIWNTVIETFVGSAFPKIAEQRLAKILELNSADTSPGRRQIIRELAEYIIGEDYYIGKLDAIYDEMENEKRTELAQVLLAGSSSNSYIQNAVTEAGDGNGNLGYAVLFAQAYDDITGIMYDMLSETKGVGDSVDFETLLNTYEGLDNSKGIISYFCFNHMNETVRTAAETYFELLTGYAKGKTSPYDKLLLNPSLSGYTAEQIEKYENGILSVNCLLYYATPNENYRSVIKSQGTVLGMTENEIDIALKRMVLYNVIYDKASTQNQREMDVLANEAYGAYRQAAMAKLLRRVTTNIATNLRRYYDSPSNSTQCMAYYAFVEMVEREIAAGETAGSSYVRYEEEYISENAYVYSQDLLSEMKKEYDESVLLQTTNLTSLGFIAKTFYARYFEDCGYATVTEYGDDNYDENYIASKLEEIVNEKGITVTDTAKVINGYMKDALLRGLVYYYDNVADDDRKAIVEEVSEMYTGVVVYGDLEASYITAANNGRATGMLGISIYGDLLDRDDMGADAEKEILASYYTVWAETITESVEKAIREYPQSEMLNKAPYTSNKTTVTQYITAAGGSASEADSAAGIIAAEQTRSTMQTNSLSCVGYTDAYQTAVRNKLAAQAEIYAYDSMYDEKTERGGYAYREILDEILSELVSGGAELDRLTFEETQQTALDEKLSIMENAVSQAVKTVFYADFYDMITFLKLSSSEFAAKAYHYLTGKETTDPAKELFGEQLNGSGGIINSIVNEFIVYGEIDETGENGKYIQKLTDWWKTDVIPESSTLYGKLGTQEQEIISQIHKQAYYQTNALTNSDKLTLESRNQMAYASMLTSMYLFLRDMEAELDKMPKDYFSAGNEDEYKAYIIEMMLEGDLMKDEAHSLTLAQAKMISVATAIGYEKANYIAGITGEGMLESTDVTLEDYLAKITQAVIRASQVIPSSEPGDTTEDRQKVFLRYLTKAVNYVEYTSVLGSEYYERNADIAQTNPIKIYADAIYREITGYDMNGTSYVSSEDSGIFGMLSFGKLLADAGGDYTKVIESISDTRLVTSNDFVSEDHATADDRHIIYFDRTEWDKYLNESGDFGANAYYSNQNVFIANGYKTDRITDVSGGYGYTNSLKATGFEYRLSDFTTLDLFFDTDESNPYDATKANILELDALSPELPDTVYAIGYITTGAGEEYGIKLGKVSVTEYSDEFYKLVYNATEPVEDSAYQITLKAASGYVFKKIGGIKVGYLDRNVERIYLETDAYSEGRVRPETSGDFVNMYSIYDSSDSGATAGKNVIYIDPTNEELLLAEQKSYIMPGTLAVQCGEGEKIVFTEVEWDLSNVTYGLKGTGVAGVELKVNSYKYEDEDGNTRHIKYDYKNNIVKMSVYEKDSGTLISESDYILSADDMIKWNTVLKVADQSLQSVSELSEETGSYELIGVVNANGVADVTSRKTTINPYYPVYPTQIQLGLAGDNKIIELSQSDWVPDLTKLNAIKRGDAKDLTFTAAFNYMGYEIRLLFLAMDITMPKGVKFDGGTIYLIKGEGDVKTQFEKNYGTAYFNFNEDESGAPNWQKVPVALKNYNDVRISETGIQVVEGIIGGTGIGDLDANATFRVQVIEIKNYAVLDGGYNKYVTYDYYSVPSDGNNQASGAGNAPAQMGETYIFISEDGTRHAFTAANENLEYDFINKQVKVPVTYEMEEETDARLSYNANGDRLRGFTFTMPLYNYERSNVSEIEFDKDDSGKIWNWTDIPETSSLYTDAIYWPIGKTMKASDLPTVTDRTSGMTFNLLWDLSELNVNLANVSTPGEINTGDGVVIYGYYMLKNGVWQSKELTVYIEKIDITYAIIGFTKEDGTININKNLEKTYDAQYYELPFNSETDGMKFLRSDGSYEVIPQEEFIIEYCVEAEESLREWSSSNLPLDAGVYYIRVRFIEEDYNVYITYTDGWLFKLTVNPYEIDMSGLVFENEDTSTGTITQIYGSTNAYLAVVSGLPAFKPARWFEPGEKEYLFQEYRKVYSTDERAKAEVYRNIYNRVADSMKSVIDGWYIEGTNALKGSAGFDTMTENERDIQIKAWVYDNKMDADLTIVEATVIINYYLNSQLLEYAPTDCGSYTVEIKLDPSNGNYVSGDRNKNLILRIEKDENINYSIVNTNLIYNGQAQNPEVTGLHKNGTVPYGVKLTYTYNIGNDILVVIVEGIKDDKGNIVNIVTIDSNLTTISNPASGIKSAGAYVCSIQIDGGPNYISGVLRDVAIGISAANIFINIDDIERKYLSEVADLSEYIRIYDKDGNLQSSGALLGTDKMSDLGIIAVSTPVGSHYKVGTYYTFIDGIKSSDSALYTYTEMSGIEFSFNGEIYTKLALKGYESEGSLYKDSEGNAAVISLFGNYNIFVRTHEYEEGVKAAGKYRIEQEDGSDGVSSNEELAAYIADLRDNDTKIVYLSPLTDENGEFTAYDEITVNAAVNLTIVGYRSNAASGSEAEIETKIKGIRVLKGTVTIKIVAIEASASGQTAVYVGDNAGYVTITDSLISKTNSNAANTVGLSTSVNYKERLFLNGVRFEGLSLGIDFTGGELEIENSEFVRNYNGISIRKESTSISIKTSLFSNNTNAAITSVSDKLTVRNNTFEYNAIALDLPEGSTIRTNVNNNNVYVSNGDDSLYE